MKRAFSRFGQAVGLAAILCTAACGTTRSPAPSASNGSDSTAVSCVLYARAVSGIDIRGDAYTWWDLAAGRYLRGQLPEPGAVLVLAKTDRLQLGHLAVVRQVIDDRDILVDHSNWVPGQIITGMRVEDVSAGNDWTQLRFFNTDYGVYGSIYPADGFIYQMTMAPTVGAAGSGQGTSGQGTSGQGTSGQGTSGQGTSGQLGLQAAAQ